MRPEPLFSLFTSVTSLPGIGPRISQLIKMIAGENLVDLLWHLPSGLIDRRYAPKIFEAKPGAIATLTVTINQHVPPRNRRLPYKIICSDETGKPFNFKTLSEYARLGIFYKKDKNATT